LQPGSRGRLEFRFLGALDEEIIREFSCSTDSPWSRKIDLLIQTDLFDVLVDPAEKVSALGGFLEGQFVAIATFEPDPNDQDKWHLPVMAVHRDFQGQGFGQQMKDRLLEHLETFGRSSVYSLVDAKNLAMLEVNKKLGATIERDPSDKKFQLCTLRLNPRNDAEAVSSEL
jgi:GNAT superfamily N-acetyltransferase